MKSRTAVVIGVLILAVTFARAQGAGTPPTIVHFSGTNTFTFFNGCTGENVDVNEAFSGVLTVTVTSSGLNHADVQITSLGSAVGETTGTQYAARETAHESQAGTAPSIPYADTFTDNFKLINQGGGATVFTVTFHLTITATGQTSVDSVKTVTHCP